MNSTGPQLQNISLLGSLSNSSADLKHGQIEGQDRKLSVWNLWMLALAAIRVRSRVDQHENYHPSLLLG